MRKTKIINFFGGPNTGKSTTSDGLSYRMKVEGDHVERVSEYAKELVMNAEFEKLRDQLAVSGEQARRQNVFMGTTDFIITDSPILLGLAYGGKGIPNLHRGKIMNLFNEFDNINFVLLNDGDLPYQQEGRNESPEQALVMNQIIMDILHRMEIPYYPIKIRTHDIDLAKNHVNDIYQIIKNHHIE